MDYIKYFLKHLEYLLLEQIDTVARADYFGVLFDQLPTYQEIVFGTQDLDKITGLNEVFKLLKKDRGHVVHLPVSAWNRLKSELLRWHETFEVSPLPSLAQ